MNEEKNRAELIALKLQKVGWGVAEDSKIPSEYIITAGKLT